MTHIQLPISKSIANRVLVLQALNGEPLMDVSAVSIPEDVRLMHNALDAITHGADEVNVENCGTANQGALITGVMSTIPRKKAST